MSQKMSIAEYYKALGKGGLQTRKYGNSITEYNGRRYHSAKEAKYAEELDWKLKGKVIKSWKPQVRIRIDVNGQHICDYILDFLVENNDGSLEYIDIKGYKKGVAYQFFKIKKNLIKAIHNIEIKEL